MSGYKDLFSLPDDVHYINCAYMSPLLRSVEAVGIEAIRKKSRPYQIKTKDFFEPVQAVKKKYTQLLGNEYADQIAMIPSVSYGIAHISNGIALKPGQKIVLAKDQFPSNVYPWLKMAEHHDVEVVFVSCPHTEGSFTESWSQAIIDAIDHKTAVVALPQVHWANGIRFDLVNISAKVRSQNAILVIDGTQSIGAMDFPFDKIKPDAVICAGYKWLMGPPQSGFGYYSPRFDEINPIEDNWLNRKNSEDFRKLVNYQKEYKPSAQRFSVGESWNYVIIDMLYQAMTQLIEWPPSKIQDYCKSLFDPYRDRILNMGLSLPRKEDSGAHLFGIGLPGTMDFEQLKSTLESNNVYVSMRGQNIRVSPHLYNTKDDIEALVSALEKNLIKH